MGKTPDYWFRAGCGNCGFEIIRPVLSEAAEEMGEHMDKDDGTCWKKREGFDIHRVAQVWATA